MGSWDVDRGAAERERMAAEWREAADWWRREAEREPEQDADSWSPERRTARLWAVYRDEWADRDAARRAGDAWAAEQQPGEKSPGPGNTGRAWTRPWLPRWARWGFDRSPDDTFTRRAARFAAREGIHLGVRWATQAFIAGVCAACRRATEPASACRTRRRVDTLRRVRRMDGTTAAVALAGGWRASPGRSPRNRRAARPVRSVRQPAGHPKRTVGLATGDAAVDAHPGWLVRRIRVASWVTRAVAHRAIRPASVPDAWVVACAAVDGIDAAPASERDDRSVPNSDHRRK